MFNVLSLASFYTDSSVMSSDMLFDKAFVNELRDIVEDQAYIGYQCSMEYDKAFALVHQTVYDVFDFFYKASAMRLDYVDIWNTLATYSHHVNDLHNRLEVESDIISLLEPTIGDIRYLDVLFREHWGEDETNSGEFRDYFLQEIREVMKGIAKFMNSKH